MLLRLWRKVRHQNMRATALIPVSPSPPASHIINLANSSTSVSPIKSPLLFNYIKFNNYSLLYNIIYNLTFNTIFDIMTLCELNYQIAIAKGGEYMNYNINKKYLFSGLNWSGNTPDKLKNKMTTKIFSLRRKISKLKNLTKDSIHETGLTQEYKLLEKQHKHICKMFDI